MRASVGNEPTAGKLADTPVSIATRWRTVRHLRREQIVGRFKHWLPRTSRAGGPALPLRQRKQSFGAPIYRAGPIRSGSKFQFLNRAGAVRGVEGWNASDCDRLWLYNLHYFDWLREKAAPERVEDDAAWIERWMAENPIGHGAGWEPYPLSLRIVNWIAWLLTIGKAADGQVESLAAQARQLARSLEYHLLGNHLFVNAKALIFAGAFFAGDEAEQWLKTGSHLLQREIREQILPDGGHFELSPMYHALILEDILDLLGLAEAYPDVMQSVANDANLKATAAKMIAWLDRMKHPDGQIAYFNDAAFGIAPTPDALVDYANRRGVTAPTTTSPFTVLRDSGYVAFSLPPIFCVFDCGRIGPDYLPGHAHADTLSFELSVGADRIISNSGTSTYARGREREWERSTRAHATVEIDDTNSAEVWASFRVGRRPNVGLLQSASTDRAHWVECQHDGFGHLQGAPVHRRRLTVAGQCLNVEDAIDGAGSHIAMGRFPVHPGIKIERSGEWCLMLDTPSGRRVDVRVDGPVNIELTSGRFASGFGATTERPVIEWQWRGSLPVSVRTQFRVVS